MDLGELYNIFLHISESDRFKSNFESKFTQMQFSLLTVQENHDTMFVGRYKKTETRHSKSGIRSRGSEIKPAISAKEDKI